MKTSIRLLVILLLVSHGTGGARATIFTWQGGGGNNNWNNGANWDGGLAPASSLFNTDILFGASAFTSSVITPDYNVHSLTFASGASAYTLRTGQLTIGAGGLIQNAANAQTFSTARVIVGGNQTWQLASGAGGLSFNAGVDTAGSNLIIDAATTTGSGNSISGSFSGSGSLTKTGAGILTLSGSASTYSGGTTIQAGTLAFGNSNLLGTGAISLMGGELRATGTTTSATGVTNLAGQSGTISAAPSANLTLQGFVALRGNITFGSAGQTGIVTLANTGSGTALDATLTVNAGTLRAASGSLSFFTGNAAMTTIAAGATLDFNSADDRSDIRDLHGAGTILSGSAPLHLGTGDFSGVISGTAGVLKDVGGTLTLSGLNNFSGGFSLSAGTLRLGSDSALGGSINLLTLGGGILTAVGGDRIIGQSLSVTANSTIGSSSDSQTRAFTFMGGGSTNIAAGATLTVSNDGVTTFSTSINGIGALVKNGSGTLILNNPTNTFQGGVTLNGGTLGLSSESILGQGAFTLNAGRLEFLNNAQTSRTFNLPSAMTIAPAAGKTLTYGSGAAVNGGFLGTGGTHAFANGSTLNGATSALGSSLTTAGNVTFSNATLRGALTQLSGTLAAMNTFISSAGTLAVNGTVNTNGVENDGVLNINTGGTVANSGSALVLGAGSRTTINSGSTLSTAAGTSIELNGSSLTNNGIQGGILNVNFGSLAKGGGTFGTVNVNDGGRFAPGNSPGTATLGSLSLTSGSRYEFELNSANAASGQGADFLNVLGNLALSAGTSPNSVFTIAIISLDSFNQTAPLADFDATERYTFTLATAAGGISGFSPNDFRVDTTGFGNSLQGGAFAVTQTGNSLELQFHPVPEPSAIALFLSGLALAGFRHFRTTRKTHS